MPSQEEIENQEKLLAAHRETLAILLIQQARATPTYAPPSVISDISKAREDIRRIKKILREWNIYVRNYPDDGDDAEDQKLPSAVGESILEDAARAAQYELDLANDLSAFSIQCCKHYLRAAEIAIEGLEKERDDILIQAEICKLESGEIQVLQERIGRYLGGETLRPKLRAAIYEITIYCKGLQEYGVKMDTSEGLIKTLNDYMEGLLSKSSVSPSASGVDSMPVIEVKNYLRDNKTIDQQFKDILRGLIAEMDKYRDKEPGRRSMEAIGETRNELKCNVQLRTIN